MLFKEMQKTYLREA